MYQNDYPVIKINMLQFVSSPRLENSLFLQNVLQMYVLVGIKKN